MHAILNLISNQASLSRWGNILISDVSDEVPEVMVRSQRSPNILGWAYDGHRGLTNTVISAQFESLPGFTEVRLNRLNLPGAMTFTRMPRDPTSLASDFENPTRPALVAL